MDGEKEGGTEGGKVKETTFVWRKMAERNDAKSTAAATVPVVKFHCCRGATEQNRSLVLPSVILSRNSP